MRTLTLITVGLAALALASPLSAAPSSKLVAATITVHNSRYGHVLFDGRGFVLYAFTRDTRGHSACYGACARAWPPYLVKRPLKPASGVKGSLVGTTKRRGGSLQLTYAGRPLYFYVGDRKPRQILCQNVSEFGGLWLVIRPTGQLVR